MNLIRLIDRDEASSMIDVCSHSNEKELDMPTSLTVSTWRSPLWIALLVATSVAFSLGFACATPFAAFAAVAALTLPRHDGLALVIGTWLANQVVGFAFLHYPWTLDCAGWGLCLGAVSIGAFFAAEGIAKMRFAFNWLAAFFAAFAVYEGALFLVSMAVQSETGAFAPAIVARIFTINAAAFAGLLVIDRLGSAAGLNARGLRPAILPRGTA
jgi:hypothetical protein